MIAMLRKLFGALLLLLLAQACAPRKEFVDLSVSWPGPVFEYSHELRLDSLPPEVTIVILNFFAPGCPPCEEEVPELKKIAGKWNQSKDVRFIAIGSDLAAVAEDVDLETAKKAAETFVTKFKITYPVYVANSEQLKKFRLSGFPETFLLRREKGKWVFEKKYLSVITEKKLTEAIAALRETGPSKGKGSSETDPYKNPRL